MSQHDMNIANAAHATVRADLNNALAALVSNNSGATAPSTTFAYEWWADTTTGKLKIRNAANNAWIEVGTLASANLGLAPLSGATFTGNVTAPAFIPNTATVPTNGVFLPAANAVGIATNSTERMRIDSSGNTTFSSGSVAVTNANTIGYGTGAGGTVTQATSKSTAVTLNKPCGQITMNNAALAGGARIGFTLNNSLITTDHNLVVTPVANGNYRVDVSNSTGAATIYITNLTGGSLSEALQLDFAVISGATA